MALVVDLGAGERYSLDEATWSTTAWGSLELRHVNDTACFAEFAPGEWVGVWSDEEFQREPVRW